ncbi:hypothetical protein GCM10012275_54550 [Longimycelium tulufanense]|uniref:Uncharacterized protein n=1 Tax=Longimycelium tulufanense TaxID=907463 RepID=A0A8J3CJJ8_9PSEU|nr:hypothetical protein [Longimycelium tulufanense]GGM76962.1 hypothetical protein GCM10012275_54550 [Longimycelium tulufanense]
MSQLGQYVGVPRDALAHFNTLGRPSEVFHRANLPRAPLDDLANALTDAVMTSVPIYLHEGDTVTNLTFISGATAASGPTNWWFALYSNAATPALLAQTADQTTAAWAADTVMTLPLQTPQTITVSGIYWAAVMFHHTTGGVPSLIGAHGAKPVLAGEHNLAQTSGSGLTATAPATIASPTVQRPVPLVLAT